MHAKHLVQAVAPCPLSPCDQRSAPREWGEGGTQTNKKDNHFAVVGFLLWLVIREVSSSASSTVRRSKSTLAPWPSLGSRRSHLMSSYHATCAEEKSGDGTLSGACTRQQNKILEHHENLYKSSRLKTANPKSPGGERRSARQEAINGSAASLEGGSWSWFHWLGPTTFLQLLLLLLLLLILVTAHRMKRVAVVKQYEIAR